MLLLLHRFPSRGNSLLAALPHAAWILFLIVTLSSSLFSSRLAWGQDLVVDDIEILEHRAMFVDESNDWGAYLVALKNRSDKTRSLEVVIETGTHSRETRVHWQVELSPQSTKRRIIPAFVGHQRNGRGAVVLYENGARLGTLEIDRALSFHISARSYGQSQENFLLATQGVGWDLAEADAALRRRIGNSNSSKKAEFQRVDCQDLPTRVEAYSNIDHIVLFGVVPGTLNAAKVSALRHAVQSGKTAWIVPGKGGEGNDWIEAIAGHDFKLVERDIGGQLKTVFEVVDEPGEAQSEFDDVVTQWTYADGLGRWNRMSVNSFDYRSVLIDSTWSKDYANFHPRAVEDWNFGGGTAGWQRALDAMVREHVPLPTVFGILVAYLVLIGPGLFWYLRRKGRLILLLWLQPVVVILFVGVVYIMGWVHFGALAAGQETLVLYQPPNTEWAYGYAVHTQYNPVAGTRDLEAKNDALPLPLTSERSCRWDLDTDSGTRLTDFYLPTWSHSHFVTSGGLKLGRGVQIERRAGSVTIRNQLPFTIKNPHWGNGSVSAEIRPGQEHVVDLTQRKGYRFGPGDYDIAVERLKDDVRRCFDNSNKIYIFELVPEELPDTPFSIKGEKRSRRALLVVRGGS